MSRSVRDKNKKNANKSMVYRPYIEDGDRGLISSYKPTRKELEALRRFEGE